MVTAAPPGFSVSLSPTSGTVTAGSAATSTISVTPAGGFNSPTSLSCSGLPAYSTCSFSPASLTPNGTSAATSTLTINTNVASATAMQKASLGRPGGGFVSFAVLGCGGLFGMAFFRRRKQCPTGIRQFFCLLALLCGLAGALAGCGGGSSGGQTTPAGTYSVVITGTAGADAHTSAFSLTVQ